MRTYRHLLTAVLLFLAFGAASLFAQTVYRTPSYRAPISPNTPPQVRMVIDPHNIPSPPSYTVQVVGDPELAPVPAQTISDRALDLGEALATPPRTGTGRTATGMSDFPLGPADGDLISDSKLTELGPASTARSGAQQSRPLFAVPTAEEMKRQTFNENLAKLAKLKIEQKDVAATLALTKKIDDPAMKAKTLTELAEYIAHDPNFKAEAAILLQAATEATLELGGMKMSDLPELASPAKTSATQAPAPSTSAPAPPKAVEPALKPATTTPTTVTPTAPKSSAPKPVAPKPAESKAPAATTPAPKSTTTPQPKAPTPAKSTSRLPTAPAPAASTLDSDLPDSLELDDEEPLVEPKPAPSRSSTAPHPAAPGLPDDDEVLGAPDAAAPAPATTPKSTTPAPARSTQPAPRASVPRESAPHSAAPSTETSTTKSGVLSLIEEMDDKLDTEDAGPSAPSAKPADRPAASSKPTVSGRPMPRPATPSTATPSTRPARSAIPKPAAKPATIMDKPISSSPLDEDEEFEAPGSN